MTLFQKFILMYQLPRSIMPWPSRYMKKPSAYSFITSSHPQWAPRVWSCSCSCCATSHRIKIKVKQLQNYRELRLLLSVHLTIWDEIPEAPQSHQESPFLGCHLYPEKELKNIFILHQEMIYDGIKCKCTCIFKIKRTLHRLTTHGVLIKTRTQIPFLCYF